MAIHRFHLQAGRRAMSEIDLYEIGTELLGDEPAEGEVNATAIRIGTLQGMIDHVNAALVHSSKPTQRAATAGMATVVSRMNASAGAPHQAPFVHATGGMTEHEAVGAAVPKPRPNAVLFPDLVPAGAQTIIQAAHAPSRNLPTSVPMVQWLAPAELLERGHTGAEMRVDRITAPAFFSLLAKAGPDRDEHAPQVAFVHADEDMLSPAAASQRPGVPETLRDGIPANVVDLPQDPFPWRAAGIAPGAKTCAVFRQKAAGGARDTDRFARTGANALIGQADGAQSHRTMRAEMSCEAGRAWDDGAGVGAMIEGTWRRIQRPDGKAETAARNAAYLGEAGGSGAVGLGAIGAIVMATLAVAAEQLAAREQTPGRDTSLPGGAPVSGVTPDRPLYTRIVADQSPIPTMVTNHDALTNATVSTIAQHQSALPTAPTGVNNNLVPPAPGVPAPGSYLP
jgi:hypothetical protein